MNKRLPYYVLSSTLIISTSIGITGCSGQSFPGSQLLGGQQQASYIAPTLKPLKEIATNTSAATLWQIKTGNGISHVKIHPYANGTSVFAATGHDITAWVKSSGKLQWRKSLGENITGGVNGGNGSIFAGTISGKAYALEAATGNIKWITSLDTEILAVSESSQGIVVIRTIDGKLHGLNSENGELLWQRIQRTPELSHYGASVPQVLGQGIIAGFDNGVIASYSLKTGQPIWEIKLSTANSGSATDKLIDIDGRLKILGNGLFTTNGNGRIIGANIADGTVGWTRAFSSYTGVEANEGGVYSTDSTGNIWKLNPQNGQQLWKQDALLNRQPTAPTLTKNGSHLVIGDKQGNLHWVSTQSGDITDRVTGDPLGYNTPAINSDGVMYTLGRSGVLTATSSK